MQKPGTVEPSDDSSSNSVTNNPPLQREGTVPPPSPWAKCRCGHDAFDHFKRQGRCYATAQRGGTCTCGVYQPHEAEPSLPSSEAPDDRAYCPSCGAGPGLSCDPLCERGTSAQPEGASSEAPRVVLSLEEWLRQSLRSGYLFGRMDEPLDDNGKRLIRAIVHEIEMEADGRTLHVVLGQSGVGPEPPPCDDQPWPRSGGVDGMVMPGDPAHCEACLYGSLPVQPEGGSGPVQDKGKDQEAGLLGNTVPGDAERPPSTPDNDAIPRVEHPDSALIRYAREAFRRDVDVIAVELWTKGGYLVRRVLRFAEASGSANHHGLNDQSREEQNKPHDMASSETERPNGLDVLASIAQSLPPCGVVVDDADMMTADDEPETERPASPAPSEEETKTKA